MKRMNVLTASTLLLTLTLGACSKSHDGGVATDAQVSLAEVSQQELDSNPNYSAWKKLITSDEKNIALAEILSSSVAAENQGAIKELVASLSNEDIQTIIKNMQSEQEVVKKNLLFRKNPQLEGSELFRKSILQEDYNFNSKAQDPDAKEMTINTFSYLKSKSLDEIYKSFDDAIAESSKDIAQAMMANIAKNNPSLSAEIENAAQTSSNATQFGAKLKKSTAYLAKADEFFKYSGLNTKEQLMMVATASVGAVMYLELKDNKTMVEVVKKIEKVKGIVVDVKQKIDLVKMTVEVIKKDRDQISQATKDLNEGLSGAQKGIQDTFNDIKNAAESSDKVNSKKTAQFLYDRVIKGKTPNKDANPSILNSQKIINDNLEKSFKAVGTMADSLSNIIDVTTALSAKLGIKLPSGMQKALQTASKISAGVKLASAVAQGFMSGGVLTAMSALSSGPLSGLIGGNTTDPAVMAALGRIEAKLDVVLENQQKMMEMQIETIKMIKNLAVMIDEYHQKEMAALASLHDDIMVTNEIGKANLNKDLQRCENLIDYQLAKFWQSGNVRKSVNGSTTSEVDFDKFYSNFKTYGDFKKFVRGTAENDYSICQDALASAFGHTSVENNPLLAVYNSEEDENLYAFQRDIYNPLLSFMKNSTPGFETKGVLHIPVVKIDDLDLKNDIIKRNYFNSSTTNYELEKLYSSKALEKYLSSYLILYPILEFDKHDWMRSLPDLIENYYKNISTGDELSLNLTDGSDISRGYFSFSNALQIIQSTIAQESILAGENLIPGVYKILNEYILKNNECTEGIVCATRSNKLFMRNYLIYSMKKNFGYVNNLEKYKAAYEAKDLNALYAFLNLKDDDKGLLKLNENKEITLSLKGNRNSTVVILLPSAEEVGEGQMLYSENMPRLLKMQKDVIQALAKLSPAQFRTVENRNGVANLLLLKEF
jgi:uncharacterized protein YoxC